MGRVHGELAVAWLGYAGSVEEARGRLDYVARAAQEHAARAMERNEVVLQTRAALVGRFW